MSRPARAPAPDQAERDAAVRERARNVLIDAGAGTGKTTILVDRLVEMVAPTAGDAAVSIERIAAITFTRKAAGELRLRIRERLLEELARRDLTPARDGQLREAVAGLDTAYVGTIHSFADRLLRLRPVEADLSPSYEIAEDTDALVRETVDVLLHAVQSGTLAAELDGTPAAARAEEATRTMLFALAVGSCARSRARPSSTSFTASTGSSPASFAQRDVPPPDGEPAAFDLDAFRAAADEMVAAGERLTGTSRGRALAPAHGRRAALDCAPSPSRSLILRELRPQLDRAPRTPRKGTTFGGDDAAWDLWKTFSEGGKQRNDPAPRRPLRPARPLAGHAPRAPLPGGGRALRAGQDAPPPARPARSPRQAARPPRRQSRGARRVPAAVRPRLRRRVPGHGSAPGRDHPAPVRARARRARAGTRSCCGRAR